MLFFPCTGRAYQVDHEVQWAIENEFLIFIFQQQPQQVNLTFKATTEITLPRLHLIWMAKSFKQNQCSFT